MNQRNFFAELKRRNVFKVAIAYVVGGWALSQGIAQVFPVFDVPNWAIRFIVVLIIVGLPVALVLAWLTPDTHFPSQGLAITYAKKGRDEDAHRILEQLIEKSRQQYVAADAIAGVYAVLGEKDEAFRWLDRAFDEHSASMVSFTSHPEFRSLRSDPRFTELLRRIGIDPAQVLSRQKKE